MPTSDARAGRGARHSRQIGPSTVAATQAGAAFVLQPAPGTGAWLLEARS
jgi:hypothetical protein